MRVVLVVKYAVVRRPGPVGRRIPPAVEQVSAAPLVSAGMADRLGGRRGVINDPDFAEVTHAQNDLVEFRVVVDGVGVRPVGRGIQAIIDVNKFRVILDDAEVVPARVEILNQMIPEIPRPDDVAALRIRGFDFDDLRHEHALIIHGVRIAARGEGVVL
ncbi:MAG: hypothetical protein M5R36_28725 [Deltaproteobacteria bacterium]|nr:hypothetical protein [Deltaproteobacteria bacterium]